MRIQLKSWQIQAGAGVVIFGVGIGAGYLFARYKSKKDLNEASFEVEELKSEQLQLDFKRAELDREFNSQIQQAIVVIRELKEDGRAHLSRLADNMHTAVVRPVMEESIRIHPSNPPDEENIVINVFPNEDDDWDYDEELKHRSPDKPYIIHRDEYFSNELDYRQSTLTYYEGDNILCDEQDVPVYNPDKVAGKFIFGHGSQDISICYVRNDHLQAEYEILVDHGYYQQEVLGADIEQDIKHSRVPKFKRE